MVLHVRTAGPGADGLPVPLTPIHESEPPGPDRRDRATVTPTRTQLGSDVELRPVTGSPGPSRSHSPGHGLSDGTFDCWQRLSPGASDGEPEKPRRSGCHLGRSTAVAARARPAGRTVRGPGVVTIVV
jgi:hypothetical protein